LAHETHRPDADPSSLPPGLKPPVVHQFSIDKETRMWILVVLGVLGAGGAGAAVKGATETDAITLKQMQAMIETEKIARRDCEQKRLAWLRNQDRVVRSAMRKLGVGIQGANYEGVDYHPEPGPSSDAPRYQPKQNLPEPPSCEPKVADP
jgi:hypothetical protein